MQLRRTFEIQVDFGAGRDVESSAIDDPNLYSHKLCHYNGIEMVSFKQDLMTCARSTVSIVVTQ